jgi:hypothetical protein
MCSQSSTARPITPSTCLENAVPVLFTVRCRKQTGWLPGFFSQSFQRMQPTRSRAISLGGKRRRLRGRLEGLTGLYAWCASTP